MKKLFLDIRTALCSLILMITQLGFAHQPEFSTAGFFELPNTGRTVYSMNPAWRLHKGSADGAEPPDFNDKEWNLVSLPDGIEYVPSEASGCINYQGEVWYRKHFTPEEAWKGKQLFLHFEAIMGKSKVWINGQLVKEHFGGFLPVIANITEYLRYGQDNVIAVWADNSNDPSYPPGKAQDILDTFDIEGGGTIEKVWDMAKYVVAFEEWVKDEHLGMIASHYDGFAQGKAGVLDSMLIPAFSMLIKQGTACAVEGDMKVAMAMSILKTISGTGQLSEMYSIDFNDDICIIGHSGSGDADISDKKPTMKIVPVFHGKTGGGYLTQFYPYTGPVTYLAITQDKDGNFKFVVAEGVNEEGPILSFGDTNMRTRFTCGAREFVNRWSEAGPTHHMAAATGRHIDTILKGAKIINVPVDIVTR